MFSHSKIWKAEFYLPQHYPIGVPQWDTPPFTMTLQLIFYFVYNVSTIYFSQCIKYNLVCLILLLGMFARQFSSLKATHFFFYHEIQVLAQQITATSSKWSKCPVNGDGDIRFETSNIQVYFNKYLTVHNCKMFRRCMVNCLGTVAVLCLTFIGNRHKSICSIL